MKSFQIVNKLSKGFICLMLIAVFSASASAQEDWYMIFGAGDTPKRAAFFVDMNSVSTSAGIARINFVSVFEETGNPQYTNSLMEFRCAKNEWRIASGGIYTNIFRILSLILIILLTVLFKRKKGIALEVNKKTIWMKKENPSYQFVQAI